ncbi:MAG TPA: bacteriohemerythrin [Bryobacteraceae bacterium]|nr:bacteriohemerythrin [Bryobacteraceae bacterium]
MFEWNNEYSVRIGSIDAQHRNLFATAQKLYAAMSAGQGKSALARILDRLVQYTASHFAHEERLMRLHGYPGLAAHKAEHEALTKRVLKFQQDYQSGKVSMTVQLLQFLKDWLEKHIRGSDMRYVPCLQKSEPAVVGGRSQALRNT